MTKPKRQEELEKEVEQLKRDYDNLLRGAYWLDGNGKKRAYAISIVEWDKSCGNHQGGAIICTDLMTAKLVQQGLRSIFSDAEVSVSTKKDIFNDQSNEWKTV